MKKSFLPDSISSSLRRMPVCLVRVYMREHELVRTCGYASVVESMHTVFCIFLRLDTDIFEFHEQRGESTTDSTINFDFHHDSRPYFDSA